MAGAAAQEDRPEHDRDGERGHDPRASPAPLLSLHDAEHERGDGEREQERAEDVGHAPAAWRAALDQTPSCQHDGGHADGQVDEEHEPPVGGGHEHATQRRSETRCGGRHGRQQGDAVRAPLGRERVEHQGQRRGHEEGGAEGLDHPEGHEQADRRRNRAEHRRRGEQLEPER